jgi:hypothetical protein
MDKKFLCVVIISIMVIQLLPMQNLEQLEEIEIQRIAGLQQTEIAPSFEGLVGGSNSMSSSPAATCMIGDDAGLYCWGPRNDNTANGFGNSTVPTTPMRVNLLNGTTFNSVITMTHNTCVHFTNGSVGCFGASGHGLGVSSNSLDKNSTIVYPFGSTYLTTISGSDRLICGLDNSSIIYCSGYNKKINQGDGTYRYRFPAASSATTISNNTLTIPNAGTLRQIVVSDDSTCVVNDAGSVYCWGIEHFGCPSTVLNCYTPRKLALPSNSTVVQVAIDQSSSPLICILLSNGSVGCISNYAFSTISNNLIFDWLSLSESAIYISMSYLTGCAILVDGDVECFGYYKNALNSGNGGSNLFTLGNNDNFTNIVVASAKACYTNESAVVKCWGSSSFLGGTGSGSWTDQATPQFPGNRVYISAELDIDSDNLNNPFDFCPEGYANWNYNSSDDFDKDGCHDTIEDIDDDNDGYSDYDENSCLSNPLNHSSVPLDYDTDGTCDNLDSDDDNDGVSDTNDTFPHNSYEQYDSDNDGTGDNADSDDDNDNWLDASDDFPLDSTEWRDLDNDGTGDNADIDDDGDGWNDTMEIQCGTDKNQSTSYPIDLDGDYICNSIDTDDDGDSYLDTNDDFPNDSTEWIDSDSDGTGDNADLDDDNDGTADILDDFPLNPNEDTDTDNDGTGNNADVDDDNDGTNDAIDVFPLDSSEISDNDGDGTGDNADTDDDNDGWSDSDETSCVSNPLSSSITPMDFDNDGICDQMDVDDDNDGWTDMAENNCSSNPRSAASVPLDAEGDGICDDDDIDDDNDGIPDVDDDFVNDNSEWYDTDGDGIGNNEDTDDDGDGWTDSQEYACGTNQTLSASVPDDIDGDGLCAALDQDDDGDGWYDFVEINCQSDANNTQVIPLDSDGDSLCDVLDYDDDNDGWNDTKELDCQTNPLDRMSLPLDTDSDMICDLLDNDDDNDGTNDTEDQAPLDASDIRDLDGDGIGDASDSDRDGDGYENADEIICLSDTDDSSSVPLDSDEDGVCDQVDQLPSDPLDSVDSDGDGVGDNQDAFPSLSSEQFDYDNDGIGNNLDMDDDGDGIADDLDQCQEKEEGFISNPGSDYDSDGCSNSIDMDDDNDGVNDDNDACPTSLSIGMMNATIDLDGDGCIDASEDTDRDHDGVPNVEDACSETIPGRTVDSTGCDADEDNDLIHDDIDDCENTTIVQHVDLSGCYIDSDSDGTPDFLDLFPTNPTEYVDTDKDGMGDNSDQFPLNANETLDSDNDGVGDNADQCPNGEIMNNGLAGCTEITKETSESSSLGAVIGGGSVGGIIGAIISIFGMMIFMRRNDSLELIEKETPDISNTLIESIPEEAPLVPEIIEGPSIDVKAESKDEHGFEWFKHEGHNYYRKIDSRDEWIQFQS